MAETFKCPSCAAPLEFEGKPMQKCPFCGSNVIAPSELFYRPAAGSAVDLSSLTGKALKIAEIQQELRRGNKIMAIKIFRETFGTGLKEAKDAVEAMERGESVDISGMQVRAQSFKMSPEGVNAVKKAGFAIGGSILGTFVITALIIVGAIFAIFYFTFRTVNRTIDKVTNIPSSSPGGKGNTVALDAEEVLKFGGEGTGAGKFKDNRSVAVGAGGRIYSADYSGGRVQVFDAAGNFQTQWTAEAGMYLLDMAADHKGNVYVAHSQGIMVFGADGGAPVQKATYYIQGMALTLDGRVVISINRGITVLDSNLKPVQEIKNAAESASAKSGFRELAVDGAGNIYALDAQNGDILKFAPDGKFLNRTPSNSRSPQGIAIDPKGRIFVSDVSTINAFDENGKFLKSFKTNQAFGMAFNDAGELFVASRPYVVKYKLNF